VARAEFHRVKLRRRLVVPDWSEHSANSAVAYLRERGFVDARVEEDLTVTGSRGSWLGNVTSFDMRRLRARIVVSADESGSLCVLLDVNTIGQAITEWNQAVWRLELVEVHRVLCGQPRLEDVWERLRDSSRWTSFLWMLTSTGKGTRLSPEWEAELRDLEAGLETPSALARPQLVEPGDALRPRIPLRLEPIWAHLIPWVAFALVWLVLPWTAENVVTQLALSDSSRTPQVAGEITERRLFDGTVEVRYRFQVPGDTRWFSASDGTGRENLWIPVQGDVTDDVTLQVVYLPEDPRKNQPVNRAGSPRIDALFGLGVVIGLCFAWCVGLVVVLRNRRRCLELANSGSPSSLWFWRASRTGA
jgi:hypothetical protein